MQTNVRKSAADRLRLRRMVSGLFLIGFDGHELGHEASQALERGARGAVLFSRNVRSARQVFKLCGQIREAASAHALIGIDQEGGRVARLRDGFFAPPAMSVVARAEHPPLAREIAQALGRQLHTLGINLNFAPVLDIDTNPDNPVIGDRSFGSDPETVAAFGVEFIKGLQAEGVAACGKHFPGHGDTTQDSHHDLPRLPHDRERLDRVELVPFRAAVEAGVPSIMTAHILFEALDPEVPATMSRAVVGGLLREAMGYQGVVVSDDLEMKAIADRYPVGRAVVKAIQAGVDLFLFCHRVELVTEAIDAVVAAVESGELAEACVQEAHQRVEALARRFAIEMPPQWDASGFAGSTDVTLQGHLAGLAKQATLQQECDNDPTDFRKAGKDS